MIRFLTSGAAFLGILLVATACTSAEGLALGEPVAPRPADWTLDVYVEPDAPVGLQKAVPSLRRPEELPPAVRIVGRVDAEGSDGASWASLWETAFEEARRLGGDAVVVIRWGLPVSRVDDCGGIDREKHLALEVLRYESGA